MTKVNIDDLRSKFEGEVHKGLLALQKKHQFTHSYETESFEYIVSHWYKPDFIVTRHDGNKVYIEVKGYFTAQDRNKLKFVRDQHPDIDLRLIFQRDNKLHKASTTKYSDWCNKHGFQYAIGVIPESWLS